MQVDAAPPPPEGAASGKVRAGGSRRGAGATPAAGVALAPLIRQQGGVPAETACERFHKLPPRNTIGTCFEF